MILGKLLSFSKSWSLNHKVVGVITTYTCLVIFRFPINVVLTCVQLFVTAWTVAHWAPLSLEFSRQEYWSGLSFPFPGISRSRDQNCISCISCIGRQILYHCTIWEAPVNVMHATLSRFTHVWLFVTFWTVAFQAPLSIGILQARILEWVSLPFSRGSSRPRDQTRIS